MKRFLAMICMAALLLTGCGGGGHASEVQVSTGESLRFTEREIEEAMEVAMDYFRENFDGCTMTRMEYIESKSWVRATEWAQQYGDDEAIVLFSDFDVAEHGADGSLNAGDTYTDWQWILTRDQGGEWVLRTWGYG